MTGLVDIAQKVAANVDQTVKCVFVDAAGKTIPNTQSATTIPAGSKLRVTMPMSALVTLAEPTKVALACKDVTSHAAASSTGASAARAADRRDGRARAAQGQPGRPPTFGEVTAAMGCCG